MRMWLEEEMKTYTASEDFKSNREDGFRYVDKTELLIPLLNREHETTFFLRPNKYWTEGPVGTTRVRTQYNAPLCVGSIT